MMTSYSLFQSDPYDVKNSSSIYEAFEGTVLNFYCDMKLPDGADGQRTERTEELKLRRQLEGLEEAGTEKNPKEKKIENKRPHFVTSVMLVIDVLLFGPSSLVSSEPFQSYEFQWLGA